MTDKVDVEQLEAGCYIDGHWGQYGIARVVMLAHEMGWDNQRIGVLAEKHLASMGPSDRPDLTDDEWDELVMGSDAAEEWLNEYRARDGWCWGWEDGEFFYGPTKSEEN